jgi:hypothetical protein
MTPTLLELSRLIREKLDSFPPMEVKYKTLTPLWFWA